MSHILLNASLVKKPELYVSQKDSSKTWSRLTLAQNQSVKNEKGEYVNLEPCFWNVTVFGKTAERVVNSDLPLGTPLMVSGTLVLREVPAYEKKDGSVIPARVEKDIIVDSVGVDLGQFSSKTVTVNTNFGKTKKKEEKKAESKPKAEQKAELFDDEDDFDLFA